MELEGKLVYPVNVWDFRQMIYQVQFLTGPSPCYNCWISETRPKKPTKNNKNNKNRQQFRMKKAIKSNLSPRLASRALISDLGRPQSFKVSDDVTERPG